MESKLSSINQLSSEGYDFFIHRKMCMGSIWLSILIHMMLFVLINNLMYNITPNHSFSRHEILKQITNIRICIILLTLLDASCNQVLINFAMF